MAILPLLGKAIGDREASVRVAAAEAIGKIPDIGGVAVLKPALDDDDVRVRVEAGGVHGVPGRLLR